ncbi:MAG: phosphotransferase [Acidimicrobiales bacterium]
MTVPTNFPAAPPTDEVAEIDPTWLSAALGEHASSVTAKRVGTGQMGQSWCLTITWSDADSTAPTSLVAKMAGGDPATRTLIADGYRNEFLFYTEIQSTVAINSPKCWYATITEDNTSFVLLLDNLAPSLPGIQAKGVSVDEALLSVANLAGLHAPRWADPSLLATKGLELPTREGTEFLAQVMEGAIPTFIEQFQTFLAPEDLETIATVPGNLADWITARLDRFTLIHGDYRPDNLMFAPDGSTVTTLDWQTLGLGLAGRDIGYFLATSLEPEARRIHERELVGAYYKTLIELGVQGFSLDECFEDYRLGVAQGPLITILGAVYATAEPSAESDAMFAAMITRSCAALRDLDPFSLL